MAFLQVKFTIFFLFFSYAIWSKCWSFPDLSIAKELKIRGMKSADVILAVGLPIVWVSNQREEFKKYLMQKETAEFLYKDISYRIHIKDVRIYPQGFAAVASNLTGFEGINILADIGNGTMNTLFYQ